jgi:uncharacterized protein YdhG (YjbR/CyaY superfamily)
MESILTFMAAQFPETEATIAWNKPHVKLRSQCLLGMEACKNHLFFHPFTTTLMDDFAPRLSGYVCEKRSFHIPWGWELDADLLSDIVSARIAEVS